MSRVDTNYDELSCAVIGAAMEVHSELGPGFPEKVCYEALMIALAERRIPTEKEVAFTVQFRARPVGEFPLDVLPQRVQNSQPYQLRRDAWKTAWLQRRQQQ